MSGRRRRNICEGRRGSSRSTCEGENKGREGKGRRKRNTCEGRRRRRRCIYAVEEKREGKNEKHMLGGEGAGGGGGKKERE